MLLNAHPINGAAINGPGPDAAGRLGPAGFASTAASPAVAAPGRSTAADPPGRRFASTATSPARAAPRRSTARTPAEAAPA